VTDGENEGDDCDEVICTGWGELGGEWTEWGWRNEEGSWFHRWPLWHVAIPANYRQWSIFAGEMYSM